MVRFGTLLIAVLLVIVFWTLFDGHEAARQQAEQEEGNIALTLDSGIGRAIGTLDLSLQAAIRGLAIPGLAALDPAIRQSVLFDGALAAADFGGIFVTNESGRVIYSSLGPQPRPIDISDRSYFLAHRDHPGLGLSISQPLTSRLDGALSLPISRRISRADGSFAGVAMTLLRLSYFQNLFSAIDLGEHGIVNLVSTNGFLVARTPLIEKDIGRDMSGSDMFTLLARSPVGHFEARASIDGITRLYTYRQIGNLPLVVGVGLSLHDIYAGWTRKAAIVGGALLLLAGIYLLMMWRLRHELARRVAAEDAARAAAAESDHLAHDLAQALAPLDALFRNATDPMLSVVITPSDHFVYETVNLAWQELGNMPPGNAIGRRPEDVLPAAMAQIDIAKWLDCIRERRPIRYVLTSETQSGTRYWEKLAVPVHQPNGSITRLIVVARDVTERTRMEEQLHQAEKTQVNGHITASVGHDFNNILQTVASGVELLRDEKYLSDPGRRFLDVIGHATSRGASLSHHLLAFARKQTLNAEQIDPREILQSLCVILPRTLGPHVDVVTEVAEPIGFVHADRAELETALMNLALNAAHAMPSGGMLKIAVSAVEADSSGRLNPGRYVVIAVTDTGEGMAADVLARAFEPFFTTRGPGDSGLGLAMVQGFCRQSGGDISATSRPGHGTTVKIWLPEITEPALRGTTAGPARVLLVDDSDDVLIMLDAFLRAGNFTVAQAPNAQAALATFAAGKRYDVLITDYMMPGSNGETLIRRAREYQPDLPALIITAFAGVVQLLDDLRDVAVLPKPFQRHQLLAHVNDMLAQTRFAMPQPDHR
jgi:signal transduction histidine kinase/ActR/RegA family two-component response regulator